MGLSTPAVTGPTTRLDMPIGGLAWTAFGPKRDVLGPMCGNFQNYMRQIKKTFDPNTASYPVGYISAE